MATDAITGEQIVYSYDSLNRLSSASAYTFSGSASTNCAQTTGSTSTWAETYAFDGFGNLTNKAGTGGGPNVPIGVNPTNNQITDGAPQYDANGNLTAQSGVSYTYDPENRMTYFSSVSNGNRTFGYDSQNKRILNWTGSTDQYGNASGYTVYYYGVKGERLGVYNFTGYWAGGTTPTLENSTTSTETFFGARRLAPLDRLAQPAASTTPPRPTTCSAKTNRPTRPSTPGSSVPTGAIRLRDWTTRRIDTIRARWAGF